MRATNCQTTSNASSPSVPAKPAVGCADAPNASREQLGARRSVGKLYQRDVLVRDFLMIVAKKVLVVVEGKGKFVKVVGEAEVKFKVGVGVGVPTALTRKVTGCGFEGRADEQC